MNQEITRLRPWDLKEAIDAYGDITLSEVITTMQQEDVLIYDCPKCVPATIEVNPLPTGKIPVTFADTTTGEVVCDVCNGYLKTAVEYESKGCGVYGPASTGLGEVNEVI